LTKGKRLKGALKMGYESKLYIVNKMGETKIESEKKRYAQVVAMYDICKFGAFDGLFQTVTNCYIYADDGDTEILEDRYGEPLKEATITEVIEYLEKYKENKEPYKRVEPLLALLKGFNLEEWENLKVLHYGY
jgi:hypothetical protein